ncbi:MAG: septum site-determining protein MinD [Lachnospiraceae bacterium]|nr:septum site-determining protein MinD [Lachnospiraceae bacterium]
MGEVLVITSGKGGVGKTTSAACIGTGLAMLDRTVLMIDTDTGLRNLDVILGLENRIVYNLVDVVEGNCRLKQALIRDRSYPGLYLLPTAQTRDKASVSPEHMIKLVDSLREDYDFIILDCPAGIEQGFQSAIAAADRALIVTTPEVSSIRDADRVMGLLEDAGIRQSQLLVNLLLPLLFKQGDLMSADDVTVLLGFTLIGVIPDDEAVLISTNQGVPLITGESLAAAAYRNIVRRILGEEVPFLNLEPKKSFWARFFHT